MNCDFIDVLTRLGRQSGVDHYSHEWLGDPKTYWRIENSDYAEFYRAYCDSVNGDCELLLAEKIPDNCPVVVELSLTFNSSDVDAVGGEIYGNEFILAMVHTIQSQMLDLLKVLDTSDKMLCVVLESEYDQNDDTGITTVDIRFQFPNCKVETRFQRDVLLPSIATKLRRTTPANLFHCMPINMDWNNLIVHGSNTLLMYYSCRSPGALPMMYQRVVGYISESALDDHDMGRDYDLTSFPLSNHTHVSMGILPESIFGGSNNSDSDDEFDEYYLLPVILSVNYCHTVTMPKSRNQDVRPIQDNGGEMSPHTIAGFNKGDIDEVSKLKLCDVFLHMWDVTMLLNHTMWRNVGEAIYDATDGSDEGLELWCVWTTRAMDTETYATMIRGVKEKDMDKFPAVLEKGQRNHCGTVYKTFRTGRITVKTLAWHARLHNLKAYRVWHYNWCKGALEAATSLCHYDVAQAFYRLYWLDFTCTYTGKTVTWYMFIRHKLKQTPKGVTLAMAMSGDFVRRFQKMRSQIMKDGKTAHENENSAGETIITNIGKLISLLKNNGYKGSILGELIGFYINIDLDKLLDDNFELMGLPNGVLVVDEAGAMFRPGRPEDYVTMSAKASYHTDYTYNHPMVKTVLQWWHQIFVDAELFDHFNRFASSILRGGNNDKKIPCFSGKGDNSKSMLVKLFEEMLGEYSVKLPVSIATGGRGDANGPSPAVARLKGCRICWLEEPEKGIPFQVSLLKQLSGFDSFFGRMLKKNGGDIRPSFKMVIVCNDVPSMPNGDKAMKNRFCILPFLSTWVKKPPTSIEEQYEKRLFQADTFFEKKIGEMISAALWIMVDKYNNEYIPKGGLGETPEIVKKYTQDYWDRNDVYYQYISNNIEISKDKDGSPDLSCKVSTDTIYETFRAWFHAYYPNTKVSDRPTVMEAFVMRWGNPVLGLWSGMKLKNAAPEKSGSGGLF